MERKIKAVIFDMDGVMVDSERKALACFEETCNQLNIEFDREFYISTIGRTYKQCDDMYTEKYGLELFNKIHSLYQEMYESYYSKGLINLKKGCREIISYLQENNIPYALATSSPYRIVEASFLNQGYEEVPFKYVMTGEHVKKSKPDPEIFIRASELMNVNIKACMIIEDSRNGIIAAKSSGAISVLVPDIIEATKEMKDNADYIKEDLIQVRELIEQLISK